MKGIDLDSRGLRPALPPDSQMFPPLDLHSFVKRVDSRIGFANTVQVEPPAERRTFEGLTPREVSVAATLHNLHVVHRMGGRQLEFTRISRI